MAVDGIAMVANVKNQVPCVWITSRALEVQSLIFYNALVQSMLQQDPHARWVMTQIPHMIRLTGDSISQMETA